MRSVLSFHLRTGSGLPGHSTHFTHFMGDGHPLGTFSFFEKSGCCLPNSMQRLLLAHTCSHKQLDGSCNQPSLSCPQPATMLRLSPAPPENTKAPKQQR